MEDTTALYALTEHLTQADYTFICPSPETQGRVVASRRFSRSTGDAENATDFFGWNLPCSRHRLQGIIPERLIANLEKAHILKRNSDNKYLSTIRISNFYLLNEGTDIASPIYYIHSSFPTTSDSVFFGPDTYLFLSFLSSTEDHLPKAPRSIIDVCCGAGAGAIHLARAYPGVPTYGLDLNQQALHLGAINAQLAKIEVTYLRSDLFDALPDALQASGVDVIVSNPPYIASSPSGRAMPVYANGGADIGLELSMRIMDEGSFILSKDGIIILYTGVAIPATEPGSDVLLAKLRTMDDLELVQYTILHPDMWSEEIGKGAYVNIGRIQAVGAVLRKRGISHTRR